MKGAFIPRRVHTWANWNNVNFCLQTLADAHQCEYERTCTDNATHLMSLILMRQSKHIGPNYHHKWTILPSGNMVHFLWRYFEYVLYDTCLQTIVLNSKRPQNVLTFSENWILYDYFGTCRIKCVIINRGDTTKW